MPNRYMIHKERRVFLQLFKCYKNTRHGARYRTRTCDPMHVKHVLYQLS